MPLAFDDLKPNALVVFRLVFPAALASNALPGCGAIQPSGSKMIYVLEPEQGI